MTLVKNFGAALLGMVVGGLANLAVLLLSLQLWPLPDGVGGDDPAAMSAYVASLPVAAVLCAMAAHVIQAGLGGWVAARVGSVPLVLGSILGVLTALGTLVNWIELQGPGWMLLELPVDVLVGAAAGQLEARRRAPVGL